MESKLSGVVGSQGEEILQLSELTDSERMLSKIAESQFNGENGPLYAVPMSQRSLREADKLSLWRNFDVHYT